MIQMNTVLEVADNTGAKLAKCIKVLGSTKRRYARLGDVIVVSIKAATPDAKVKKGAIHKAIIVRVKARTIRDDGVVVRFDDNAVVLLNDSMDEPLGTRIFGPVAKEVKDKNISKLLSLAPEVL